MHQQKQTNAQLQRRENLWRNSQEEEILDPKNPNITYKPLNQNLILRTQSCTIYKALKKQKKEQQKIKVNFEPAYIKKYQNLQRSQAKGNQVQQEYQWLSENPTLMKKYKITLLLGKRHKYCLFLDVVESTLYDKLKYGVREFKEMKEFKANCKNQVITEFIRQMLEYFQFLHSSELSIFLGGLRPQHIGVVDSFQNEAKKSYTYKIMDFSLANKKQAKNCLHLYDLCYLAPQYKQSNLSIKSDYWSFGCILYELVSNGQKLINNLYFHEFSNKGKDQFIENRLKELSRKIKMSGEGKHKITFDVITVLKQCLKINPKDRKLVEQQRAYKQVQKEVYDFYMDKILYDVSIEIFRLTHLQDNMLSVFEQFYFNQNKTVKKHHIYPLLKFASCYYLQAFNKLKDKARSYAKNDKWDKYSQVKKIQDEKKISDIKDKAASKMIKELELQKNGKKNQILAKFPEIKDDNVMHPRYLYHLYWEYVKDELCKQQNKNFYKFFYNIHFYMKEQAEMQCFLNNQKKIVIRFSKNQKQTKQIDSDILYFQCANQISGIMQSKINSILSYGKGKEETELKMMNSLKQALNKIPYY